MDPVEYILGKTTCFHCGRKLLGPGYRWYHGDQDDLVCGVCARKLRHTDTAYAGMKVINTQ